VQNPKAIARFKGLFEEDKTDTIDARRIADFVAPQSEQHRFDPPNFGEYLLNVPTIT